jgi:signal transduction histidine kinase
MLDELPPEAERERQLVLLNGIKSVLLIPLKVGGHHLASIGFVSCRVYRDWPDDLVRRLRLAGEVLASALARKRSDEVVQQRESALRLAQDELRLLAGRLIQAQEQERRRIAREMHDDWTQRLAVLAIEAAKLEQQLGRPEEAVLLVQAMRESLVSLSEDVHSLSRQLHPAILDDLGLADALRSECAGTAEREGLVVSYRPVDVPATLPKDASLCLYRVAQEALRNVVKHAQTGEAWVTLGATGWEMVLCVEDRGAGFDVAATRSRAALGLSSMLERVRLVGGELEVESKPDRGTRVTVRVPLGGGAS